MIYSFYRLQSCKALTYKVYCSLINVASKIYTPCFKSNLLVSFIANIIIPEDRLAVRSTIDKVLSLFSVSAPLIFSLLFTPPLPSNSMYRQLSHRE